MSIRKNLTGERKGTITTLDVTNSLNIDDNGCFVSSGNILSSVLITAVHGDYGDLFAKYKCIFFMWNLMSNGLIFLQPTIYP